jgi:hypothetical protein
MADELDDAIRTNAEGPKSAPESSGGTQQPSSDEIVTHL